MAIPSNQDSFLVLCMQAADAGRAASLFGESVERAKVAVQPFVDCGPFPDIYFEFPLAGDPFMDVTVLYGEIDEDFVIESEAAEGMRDCLRWYAEQRKLHPEVSLGFEVDTKYNELKAAGVHFQPRENLDLVEPFFEKAGEPERAQLYLDFAKRMPQGWKPSFFGMFRGRPESPLRVCGYLHADAIEACVHDSAKLASTFDEIGFTAYDDAMLEKVCEAMALAPGTIDYQFDVYPDGHVGDVFAIDVQFEIQQPKLVQDTFLNGTCAPLMALLERWGIADERWRQGIDMTFARAIPVMTESDSVERFAFTLMPQWLKVRFANRVLQPSKLYVLGKANVLQQDDGDGAAGPDRT